MNNIRPFLLISLLVAACAAEADEGSFTVVPAVDLAFKNSRYSFPAIDVDIKFKASYTTLVPSLTIGYGSFYGVANYDFTVAESVKIVTGSASDPSFNTIDYSRKDASLTLGYRLHPSVSLFAGYTQGKGTVLISGYDPSGPFGATRIYNANGFYAGVGLGYAITEKGSVSLSAAYGSLNGLLSGANWSSNFEIDSKAPGYSVNLAWNHAATATTSYRVGIKYTAYTFEGKEFRENGIVTPIPRAFDYYERITTFYIGIVESF